MYTVIYHSLIKRKRKLVSFATEQAAVEFARTMFNLKEYVSDVKIISPENDIMWIR